MPFNLFEFTNLSQRVIASYRRTLVPKNVSEFSESSPFKKLPDQYSALHDFLSELLDLMFRQPACFGLPETPDLYAGIEQDGKKLKASEIQPKFKKIRDTVAYFFDFLELIGPKGRLTGDTLTLNLDEFSTFFKIKPKVKDKMLKGMAAFLNVDKEKAAVTFIRHPGAAAALVDLLGYQKPKTEKRKYELWRFNFCRLDLQSISTNSSPDVKLLFKAFPENQMSIMNTIHEFFLEKEYKVVKRLYGDVSGWDFSYQGKRNKKSTPLLQIVYDERRISPFRIHIKCAAANRIVPVLENYSRELQNDFQERTYRCNGAKCGWCKGKKGMGPVVLKIGENKKTICWHTRSRVRLIDENTVNLVKEYELLHSEL